jgi:hypothetical protein
VEVANGVWIFGLVDPVGDDDRSRVVVLLKAVDAKRITAGGTLGFNTPGIRVTTERVQRAM